jgi:hypothetical protein
VQAARQAPHAARPRTDDCHLDAPLQRQVQPVELHALAVVALAQARALARRAGAGGSAVSWRRKKRARAAAIAHPQQRLLPLAALSRLGRWPRGGRIRRLRWPSRALG